MRKETETEEEIKDLKHPYKKMQESWTDEGDESQKLEVGER